jgi:hypothetical protein
MKTHIEEAYCPEHGLDQWEQRDKPREDDSSSDGLREE